MRKTKNILIDQRGVAPVLELLLVIAVIGALGFAGYRYYQSTQTKPMPPAAVTKPEYKRTTTVPADWKTYTSSEYKFSIAHPRELVVSTLEVFDDPAEGTVFGAHSTKTIRLCIKDSQGVQECKISVHILKQALNDTASQLRNDYLKDQGITVISDKEITFDGNDAVEFRYKQTAATDSQRDYFIYGNGYTYAPPGFDEKDTEAKTIFESFKILK